jgi:hypothetical protein
MKFSCSGSRINKKQFLRPCNVFQLRIVIYEIAFMKKFTLLGFALCLFSTALFAQDKIYKKKGPVINAKVIEIGVDEIKYKLTDDPDGPIYVVDKSTLKEIVYADGRTEKFEVSYKDPENYEGQLTKAIKLNFLSPLFGYTEFGFEKSISPLKSYEIEFGIIGAGTNKVSETYYYNGSNLTYKRNAFGFFADAGYKFKKLPTFFNRGMRMTHIMQGGYIKPTFTIGYYSDDALNNKDYTNPYIERRHNVFGALTLNFGKEWVFGDKFLLDIYLGLGYAFDNIPNNDEDYYYEDLYNHFVIQTGGSGSLALTSGLKIGWLIK